MTHALAPSTEHETDLPLAPAEGWLALGALLVAMFTVGTAVDAAMWAGYAVGGVTSQTSFLAGAGMLAVVVGFALAKLELRTWAAYGIGIGIGVAVLLNSIASLITPAPDFFAQLAGLNGALARWLRDVALLDIRSSETVVFLIIIGAFTWGAGMYAAMAVVRRRRPVAAIVPAALILFVNVALTVRDQLPLLVVFSAAALLLVMRLNLFQHSRGWLARGMGDTSDVAGAFLRGGALFIALAVAASAALAVNASSAPLSRAWRNADSQLIDLGYDINRWLGGVTGDARGPSALFAPTQTIRDFWESSGEEVYRATTSDGQPHYWRGSAYDDFDGRTWQQRDIVSSSIAAGSPLLDSSANDPSAEPARTQISVTITPSDWLGDVFVTPETPVAVDQPAEVHTTGAGGPFAYGRLIDGVQPGRPFTITALVRDMQGADGLTINQLAAAGRTYPAWARRYIEIREGSMGEEAYDLVRRLVGALPEDQRDPYHVAAAIQEYLRDRGGFRYRTDIRGVCRGETVVDCFLRAKVGYCEQFATTMVMMLRAAEIPARYVVGYLPGQKQSDGSFAVGRNAAHAWVEVLFPTYGWVRFDPTPGNAGNGQAPTTLPMGPAVTPPPGGPDGAVAAPNFEESRLPPDEREGGDPSGPGQAGTPAGPLSWLPLVLAAVALVGLTALGLRVLLRRAPVTQPEVAYRSLTGLARRLGHGPQPAQTAYEFADDLGMLIPTVRPELHLIATAKVEASYSSRPPAASLLAGLAGAYRRARFGLLRLIFRGGGRGLLPRAPRVTDVSRR